MASHEASERATYSASVDERAIADCFFDPQVIALPLDKKTKPEMDQLLLAFVKAALAKP